MPGLSPRAVREGDCYDIHPRDRGSLVDAVVVGEHVIAAAHRVAVTRTDGHPWTELEVGVVEWHDELAIVHALPARRKFLRSCDATID